MISTFMLLDDIRNRLKTAFEDFVFREPVQKGNPLTASGEEKYRTPRIYIGQLPPKRVGTLPDGSEQGEDVPYLLVKCLTSEVTGEQPREYVVNIAVVGEVFVPEDNPEAGLHDILNMADRVVGVFSSRRYWADDFFIQELPIKMTHGLGRADNPYAAGLQAQGPFHMMAVATQFKAAALPQLPPLHVIAAAEPDISGHNGGF